MELAGAKTRTMPSSSPAPSSAPSDRHVPPLTTAVLRIRTVPHAPDPKPGPAFEPREAPLLLQTFWLVNGDLESASNHSRLQE